MIAFVLFIQWAFAFGKSHVPFCSPVIYDKNNETDVERMLYSCSQNIRGSLFPPSYFAKQEATNEYSSTLVNTSVVFNGLVNVDDIHATVTLDFWFRQFWYDTRWKFPEELWLSINPAASLEGLEIMPYIRAQNPLNFWLPDTRILETISSDIQAEMIHLFHNGSVWWSRHFVVVLKQGQFVLTQYPLDKQRITLTIQPWAYATQFVVLQPFSELGPGLLRFTQDPTTNTAYIKQDPLWTFVGVSAVVEKQQLGSFFDPNREYSSISIILEFERESYGIVFRLALPILIFLLLVGFAFWSDISHRVEVTISMVLAVTAIYFIIGQTINVGYFSLLDRLVTTAFSILSLTAGVHYLTNNLETYQYKYPMNEFLKDFIVFLCRVLWVPIVYLTGSVFFAQKYLINITILMGFAFILMITSFNTLIHFDDIDVVFRNCLCQLRVKHYYKEKNKAYLADCQDQNMLRGENIVTLDLTTFEVLIYSFTYYFRVNCACEEKIQKVDIKDRRSAGKAWGNVSFVKADTEEREEEDNQIYDIELGCSKSKVVIKNESDLNRNDASLNKNVFTQPCLDAAAERGSAASLHDNVDDYRDLFPVTSQYSTNTRERPRFRSQTRIIPDKKGDENGSSHSFIPGNPVFDVKKRQVSADHTFFCEHLIAAIDIIDRMLEEHKENNRTPNNNNNDSAALSTSSYYHGSCDNRFCYRCTTRNGRGFLSNIFSFSFFKSTPKRQTKQKATTPI
jgi:hypothetical protein